MADDFEVTVKGIGRLQRKARKAGADVTELRAVNERAVDLALPVAERRAPVRSGALRRGIRGSATNRIGRLRSGTVGASKSYAARQHWSLQRGKPGDQYVFKAIGERGYEIARLYYRWRDRVVRQMNRSQGG